MNSKTKRFGTLLATLTVCLFSLAEAASAQSSCKQAKGLFYDVTNNTGGTSGTITNGGILNGTTETVYNVAYVITPDPNVVAYIADLTITTAYGQLKAGNVYIYNFVTGLWTAMGNINPDASTGRFHGATGVLYFNGKTTGNAPAYPSDITGQICLANQ